MGYFLNPALGDLRDEINRAFPGRAKVSDGWIGDAAHSARKSDHNPDGNGEVNAIDVTQWDPGTPDNPNDDVAEAVAEYLRRTKDPRVKYVIWRGKMFSSYATSSTPAWTWRNGKGHYRHVHISIYGSAHDGPWGFKMPGDAKPELKRVWLPFRSGDTDAKIAARGGMTHQVTEAQLILTALSIRWEDKRLDPRMHAHPGEHRGYSEQATKEFKRRIQRFQKAMGLSVWENDDPWIGPATIGMLRLWNAWTS